MKPHPVYSPAEHQPDAGPVNTCSLNESVLASILIVNYRAYGELASCLESLQRFHTGDLDVIVVDHASEPARPLEV